MSPRRVLPSSPLLHVILSMMACFSTLLQNSCASFVRVPLKGVGPSLARRSSARQDCGIPHARRKGFGSQGAVAFSDRVVWSSFPLRQRTKISHQLDHIHSDVRVFSSTQLQSAAATAESETKADTAGKVPITLLSGFLGSGKTSCLTDLLQNKAGVKVGVIVNDVASVNIDAKLISNLQDVETNGMDAGQAMLAAGQTVELQNGCACCSLSDELLTAVQSLLDGNRGKDEFDSIVVELSGVADPVAVKQNWADADKTGHPSTKEATVHRVVTLVDASTFGSDWYTWNSAGDRKDWVMEGDCAAQRKVAELLAEQVEAADVCLLNKIDLAEDEQVDVARSVVKGLNEKANVFSCTYGKGVAVNDLLGFQIASPSSSDSHVEKENEESITDDHASHSHEHTHEGESCCSNPDCTDPSHDHSHESHSHHSHDATSCSDPDCTDPSHDHSHAHSHDHDATACSDPDCNDPTHDHSHSHDHASTTSTDDLGISSFVYKRTIPFHSGKLLSLLNRWPIPIKEELDLGQLHRAAVEGHDAAGEQQLETSPFVGVLRSKGFCWLAPSAWTLGERDAWRHDTAMYWSHAGKHFGVTTAGKWWGSISDEQMKSYFKTNMGEYERIQKEDFVSEEWGDRRQEVVFIGASLDEEGITKALDACLLTEEEMDIYRLQLRNFELAALTTASVDGGGGPSLMDAGSTDHLDVNV